MRKTILILSANPKQDLDLKREIHILKGVIERSQEGDKFEIKISSAVRPQDLQKLFLEHKPRIVHFCGHGTGEQGLVLEDNEGKEKLVSTSAISDLFENFSDMVECVLLNACYSEKQAGAIAEHINYTIGMRQEIRDDAAIIFTRGFYQALGYGKSIPEAFKLGRNAIKLEISNAMTSRSDVSEQDRTLNPVNKAQSVTLPEHLKPKLKNIKSPLTPFPSEELSADSAPFPDLTEAIQKEIALKQYREAGQNDFGFGQTSRQRRETLNQQEYREQKVLLDKVKERCKKYLKNHLYAKVLFELDIKERCDAVERPYSNVEEGFFQDSDKSFEWLQARDIFEEMGAGRTLLILGEPGTGKTFSLYKLAERCIQRREQDPTLPIPVVLNLSSWGNKRQEIAKWLIAELKEQHYITDKSLSQKWIKQGLLLVLFDGLDEIKTEYRNDCVKALNKFIETYGTIEMVVCSRIQDYEVLLERLKLYSAICLQPLTSEYIDWYFGDIGKPVEGLKAMLKRDAELTNFARTPLILNVMILTYKDYSLEELLKQIDLKGNRYKQLWNNYIERMLQRRKSHQYHDNITKYCLIWLAKMMKENSQSNFRIKNMQPSSWLKNITQQGLYLGILLIIMLLTVLPLIMSNSNLNNDGTGWIINMLTGIAVIVIILSKAFEIKPLEKLKITNICKFIKAIYREFIIGQIIVLVLSIVLAVSFYSYKQENIYNQINIEINTEHLYMKTEHLYIKNVINPNYDAMLNSPSMLVPNSSAWRTLFKLFDKFNEFLRKLPNLFHKFNEFLRELPNLFHKFYLKNREGIVSHIFNFLLSGETNFPILFILAIKTQILISIFQGLPFLADPISEENDKYDHQGILQSLKNVFPLCLISGFTGGLCFGIVFVILKYFVDDYALLGFVDPRYGILYGLFFGLIVGFWASVQHFILRLIVYMYGYAPWNYTRFLNYATERLLMRKNGGAYNFIHRMLMEHFAQMKEDGRRS